LKRRVKKANYRQATRSGTTQSNSMRASDGFYGDSTSKHLIDPSHRQASFAGGRLIHRSGRNPILTNCMPAVEISWCIRRQWQADERKVCRDCAPRLTYQKMCQYKMNRWMQTRVKYHQPPYALLLTLFEYGAHFLSRPAMMTLHHYWRAIVAAYMVQWVIKMRTTCTSYTAQSMHSRSQQK